MTNRAARQLNCRARPQHLLAWMEDRAFVCVRGRFDVLDDLALQQHLELTDELRFCFTIRQDIWR